MQLQDFLSRVWGAGSGWAFLGYGTGQENFKEKAYWYPSDLDKLIADAREQNRWANVYFCVHLCKEKRRVKSAACDKIYALWIDHDNGYPEMLDPKPTICWQTSEGRFQAVWLLEEPTAPDKAEQINRYFTYKFKADNKWYLTTYLRLPETVNHKYDPSYEGSYLWEDGPLYSIDELAPKGVQEIDVVAAPVKGDYTKGIPDDLPTVAEVFNKYGRAIPLTAWRLLDDEPTDAQDWSEHLWRLERLLLEAHIPPEAAYVITLNSPWNKYARDGRPNEHLWVEINKAFKEKPLGEEPASLPWLDLPRLLTFSERPSWLVQDIWIDHTVGFAAGVGKSYKSTITMDLALSIASGTPFLGRFKVVEPGPVLIVQEEDPVWRVAYRLQAMAEKKGLTNLKADIGRDRLILEVQPRPNVPLYVSVGGGFVFIDEEKTRLLEDAIDRYRPKMLILDPLFMMTPGVDEFKSGEVTGLALNLLKHWRNKYGCAICVVHHFRKGFGSDNERLYGSMALYAWNENNLWFSRDVGNTVTIGRDIKDASRDAPKLQVRVDDIENEYAISVEVLDTDPITEDTLSGLKVRQYLRAYDVGTSIPRDELDYAVGITRKTTAKILGDFEKEGMVELVYKGRGGKVHVMTKPKLYEDVPDIEVAIP